MKWIEMAMILVASNVFLLTIECMGLPEVRAEAPTPSSGCWSSEIAIAPIAEPQAKKTIQGRVVAIERNDQDRSIAAKDIVMWVRLQTTHGEAKSVYLGSNLSLKQQRLTIRLRDVLEIQGVEMPKAKQRTLVASGVKKGNRVWKIANFADKPLGSKSCSHNG